LLSFPTRRSSDLGGVCVPSSCGRSVPPAPPCSCSRIAPGKAVMIRVLLADDQALLRMGFRLVLDAADDLTVVGEAGDGRTAIEQTAALSPDVVLMDVRMP